MKIYFGDNANNRRFLDILENIREHMLYLEVSLRNGVLVTSNTEVMYKLSSGSVAKDIDHLISCFDTIVTMSNIIGETEWNPTEISDETIEQLAEFEKVLDKIISEICNGDGLKLKAIRKYTDFTNMDDNQNQLSFWK